MANRLESEIESKALRATELTPFQGIQLHQIKDHVAEALSLIGREGIFSEYTKHDISHIDEMLRMLDDWIIPHSTKSHMTPADWLILTLSVYFHDLGMLVTRDEYTAREQSGFPRWKDRLTQSTDERNQNFSSKVASLTADELEKFLYTEFVREFHAKRIMSWIKGEDAIEFGCTHSQAKLLSDMLHNVDRTLRRDLALVCNSHHEDDLDDFEKYKTARPYGGTRDEVANLHYCAILLRTVDLLHLTRDRTPTVAYRLVNPADPISQREWAKQKAVRAVRARPAVNTDGDFDPSVQSDTVEVHAYFEEDFGFFPLSAFLDYAERQLQRNFTWASLAERRHSIRCRFPWKSIDRTNIETENFISKQFEFTLDQYKILDLLIGHTLYNDSTVVLRELVQI